MAPFNRNGPGSLLLGQDRDEEMQAEIQVADPVFFQKACLGGSLGSPTVMPGDWSTPDLVMLFAFSCALEVRTEWKANGRPCLTRLPAGGMP